MAINWFKYSSPASFYFLAGKMIPLFSVAAVLFCVVGLYIGFFVAPTDFQQGEAYRIIFIHVPAAWMSMFLYVVMAVWSGIGLAFNTRLSSMVATAIAPTGAMFTFLALWTGALWGKPMWGTWWVWDARLTSELILLFLYIGFMSLQAAIDDPRRADKAGAMIALVGVVNVPIIYFSVKWWNTLASGRHRQPYPIAQNGHHHADGHADHVDCMLDVCDCSHLDTYESHNSGAGASYRLGRRATRSGKLMLDQCIAIPGHGWVRVLRMGLLSGYADLHRRRAGSGF